MAYPERRTVVLHGHRISYLIGGPDAGQGRPVLILMHGIAGSSTTLEPLLAVQARRLGNSLRGWLRSLGLRSPDIEEQWRSYATLTGPATGTPSCAPCAPSWTSPARP